MEITAFTDGGSRGNPGPSAIGVVIRFNGKEKTYAERIKDTTNNVAEYKALIFALKKIKHLVSSAKAGSAEIDIYSDSELMVSQLSDKYKVREKEIVKLFVEAHNLILDFKKVNFNLIPREQNKLADQLVNKALDSLI